MGIISAIIALFKAVPSLERLFFQISDGLREAKAQNRLDEKLTHIDNAMRVARSGLLHSTKNEWSEDPDRSPPVSEGGTTRATMDEGSTGGGGKIGV